MSSKLNPDFFGKIDCKNLGSFLENEPYTAQVTKCVRKLWRTKKSIIYCSVGDFFMGVSPSDFSAPTIVERHWGSCRDMCETCPGRFH